MKKYEKRLHSMMQSADMETVERIAAQFPAADDAAKERIYKGIQERQRMQSVSTAYQQEHVPTVTRRHYRSIWAAAACLLICGGLIGGAAMHRPMLTEQETEAPAAASGQNEEETQVRAELPETQTAPAAAVSTETAEDAAEAPTEPLAETAVVTVPAEEALQTMESETAEYAEIVVQETAFIPAVSETQPTEAWTETMQTEVQETVRTEVQTTAQTEAVQKTFEFISLADNLPDVSGFVFTPFESEWGEKCSVETADAANRKYALHKVYEPTILPEGWEFRSKHDPSGIYDDNTIDMYMNDLWYKMISGPDGGEPLTTFYMIYEQHIQTQEILCKQAVEHTENSSLYAYAETTVNGNPAFIYRQDHPNVNQTRSVWYTLYWQQDGYLFSIYTGQIPESYLPELIRMAESVQPIE